MERKNEKMDIDIIDKMSLILLLPALVISLIILIPILLHDIHDKLYNQYYLFKKKKRRENKKKNMLKKIEKEPDEDKNEFLDSNNTEIYRTIRDIKVLTFIIFFSLFSIIVFVSVCLIILLHRGFLWLSSSFFL